MIRFDGQAVIVTGAGRGSGVSTHSSSLVGARPWSSTTSVAQCEGRAWTPSSPNRSSLRSRRPAGTPLHRPTRSRAPRVVEAIVQTALDRFGRLDAVVSNAGIFNTIAFDALPAEEWRRMLNVHLDGGFYLSQPAFRVMKDQGYGRFVFITSSAGLFGQPESAHYAAAKAGLLGLTNVVAMEGAPHGILANTVLPFGYSRMVTETVGDRDQFPAESSFLHAIEPDLVVPIVVFLASRACEVTHHNYSACAGRFGRVFVGLGMGGWPTPAASPVRTTSQNTSPKSLRPSRSQSPIRSLTRWRKSASASGSLVTVDRGRLKARGRRTVEVQLALLHLATWCRGRAREPCACRRCAGCLRVPT